MKVATAEDLVALKLIAARSQDQKDVLDILRAAELDWEYIERWAGVWEVTDRLAEMRHLIETEHAGI